MAAPILGYLEPFDPKTTTWESWYERLASFFVANGIKAEENERRVAIFLSLIGSTTYELLRTLVHPKRPDELNLDELTAVLKAHYSPKPLVIAERVKFYQRNQHEGESVAEFMATLRKLTTHCAFGRFLNDALRDRLVGGLQDLTAKKKLLTEDKLTLELAAAIAQSMEAAAHQASQMQDALSKPLKEVGKITSRQGGSKYWSRSGSSGEGKCLGSGKASKSGEGGGKKTCYRCNRGGHSPQDCKWKEAICHKCDKKGHISPACRNTPKQSTTHHVETRDSNTDDSDSDNYIRLLAIRRGGRDGSLITSAEIAGVEIEMEIDTGAAVSIISETTWRDCLPHLKWEPSRQHLSTYTGERIKVLGEAVVPVRCNGQTAQVPLIVVPGKGTPLFGRNWLDVNRIDWQSIKRVGTSVSADCLLKKYAEVFKDELGTLKDYKAHLWLKDSARPRFLKPRPVPFALKGVVDTELERLARLGILENVSHCEWAAPLVPVPKQDGSVRLCGDFKVTINPSLKVDKHPLPNPEDLFASLAGGVMFSKLDLAHAYQQVLQDDESRKYVTVNTHQGLFQYTRLPFGIASAPAVFQEIMDKVLQGISGVVCYLDDILISGSTEEEHDQRLELVLDRIMRYGLRLRKGKCSFKVSEVEYLGHMISARGLQTTKSKVTAVGEAPKPRNVQELRSFMGLVNYYGLFIRDLATIAHPLNKLQRKDSPWEWSKAQDQAFEKLKSKLTSADVLPT